MEQLEQGLQDFIEAIRQTEVYQEYHRQLALVKQDPELKRQIDDYRKRNYEMQMSEDMDFAKLEAFRQEFLEFRQNPLVDNFLAAELAFCRMMQDVTFKLTESLEFE